MASSSDTIVLYHHTDSDSAALIIKHGYIKKSGGGRDAVYGDGVYLTEIGPSSSRSIVAKNNYDDKKRGWEKKIEEGKTEVAIKIKIKRSKVKLCPGNRNVYLYKGDLYLSDVEEWDVVER
ncbi:uncharacterized protein LOC132738277 [Ruditapes philippinarum]|uniref:uncharacterized protein LOC132738277 n=1 Tax=Ruditapes philippinarum TaxID=129788 RepID=UPI00295B32C7|nr:uncharacterized protein LOC132738277 [Ruditapes philippinarum]